MTLLDRADREVGGTAGPVDLAVPPALGEPARGRRGRNLAHRYVLPLAGVTVVVVAWEAVTRSGLVTSTLMPTFTDTVAELGNLLATGTFRESLLLTLRAWAVGLLIAASIGIPLGIALGLSDRAYRFVRIPLEAIRPVPPIVILPLALLTLGGNIAFQATLIIQGALWPLLVTITYAVRDVDATTLDTARSFRFSPTRTLLFVRLPAALPLMASGLRLAAATAFAVTLVTELVGGAHGLGTVMMIGQSGGDVVRVYAVTLVGGLVGLAIAFAFGLAEKRVLRWQAGGA